MEEAWDRHEERAIDRLAWLAAKILAPHIPPGRAPTLLDDLVAELAGPERADRWRTRRRRAERARLEREEQQGELEA